MRFPFQYRVLYIKPMLYFLYKCYLADVFYLNLVQDSYRASFTNCKDLWLCCSTHKLCELSMLCWFSRTTLETTHFTSYSIQQPRQDGFRSVVDDLFLRSTILGFSKMYQSGHTCNPNILMMKAERQLSISRPACSTTSSTRSARAVKWNPVSINKHVLRI